MLAHLASPKTARQLAVATGLSVRGVEVALKELEDTGKATVVGLFKVPKAPSEKMYVKTRIMTKELKLKVESTYWVNLIARVLEAVQANQHTTRIELAHMLGANHKQIYKALEKMVAAKMLDEYKVGRTYKYNTREYTPPDHYAFKTVWVGGVNPFK